MHKVDTNFVPQGKFVLGKLCTQGIPPPAIINTVDIGNAPPSCLAVY